MAATMEDEDRIAAAVSPRNSSEEIVYMDDDDAAVITVMEEEGEEESRGDVSPDGGIFSGGASEASASNECEFCVPACREFLPCRFGLGLSAAAGPVKKRQIAN